MTGQAQDDGSAASRNARARRIEGALGALLGVMLTGLSVPINRFHLRPVAGVTVPAQLADAPFEHDVDSADKWTVSADGWGRGWTLYDWAGVQGLAGADLGAPAPG